MLRRTLVLAVLAALVAPAVAPAQKESHELMPGVVYTREVRYGKGGPLVVHTIVAPKPGGLYALRPVLATDTGFGRARVSAMQQRVSPQGTVAGVNGDLFTWETGRPSGIVVRGGVLEGRPNSGRSTLGIGVDGLLRVLKVKLFGSWQVGSGKRSPIAQLNTELEQKVSAVGVFTPVWGGKTPVAPDVIDVTVTGLPPLQPNVDLTGVVASITFGGGTPIPADGVVLQARGMWVEKLSSEAVPGAPLTLQLTLDPWWPEVSDAIGGGPLIVRDGRALVGDEAFTPAQLRPRHPRTAVGQLADGRIVLVAVDGRSRASRGIQIWELARELVRMGVVTGMALDAGGSTTMAFEGKVLNTPSDGAERAVANSLQIFYYGVFEPEPRHEVLSPNGDGVAERQQLAYKVVRPSTVDVKLLAPDGSVVWQEQAAKEPGVYALRPQGLTLQGIYTWTASATDDQGQTSAMTRTFTLNNTLGFFRLSKRAFKPRLGRTVDVSLTLGNPAKVNALVVNSRGAVVRRLYGKRVDPGELVLTWDGRNNRGRLLAVGTYTVLVRAGNELGRVEVTRPVRLRS